MTTNLNSGWRVVSTMSSRGLEWWTTHMDDMFIDREESCKNAITFLMSSGHGKTHYISMLGPRGVYIKWDAQSICTATRWKYCVKIHLFLRGNLLPYLNSWYILSEQLILYNKWAQRKCTVIRSKDNKVIPILRLQLGIQLSKFTISPLTKRSDKKILFNSWGWLFIIFTLPIKESRKKTHILRSGWNRF